jgi:enoyl-CoA hydratase/carnithine racemase
VVVVRGDGVSFSAGLDRALLDPRSADDPESVVGLLSRPDDEVSAAIDGFQRGYTWLRDPRFVSIAVVQGHAIGAGFQLALACDLRVVADDARFAMRETSLGLVPDLGGTKPLVDAVGYARALEICATGRWVEAREARELGLATLVVPRQRLDESVADLVAALTEPLHGAVAGLKQLLVGAADRGYEEQLLAERVVQAGRLRDLGSALGSG